MGRQRLIKYSDGAYHVNGKTNNSEWFPIPLQDCWHIFEYYLNEMSVRYNIKIYAFTLMNNHFHLLCSTPDENLDKAMAYFMQMSSKGINLAAGRKNHLYGGKYFWTHTSDVVGYAAIFKYILRNPIRAKLCSAVRNYPWTTHSRSSLKFELNVSELSALIPTEKIDDWLNECPDTFEESVFKTALKRKEFKIPVERDKRRKINLDGYV